MLKPMIWGLALAICIGQGAAHADTAAEMLQKGIYNEETVGNLEEAIKIYRQVVSSAGETQKLGAKAQYRLGQCLLKQNKRQEATAAFESLIEKFPNQKELVAKAKQMLPGHLKLQAAPWKAGERMTLVMRLSGGQIIGAVGSAVDAIEVDGKDAWRLSVRRYVASGLNEGVSHIVVDKATNRPISTTFDHTVLGTAKATWGTDTLEVTQLKDGKPEKKSVDLDSPAYANDQCFFAFRQLPLAVDYKTTVPIRVAFTGGNPLGLEVHVTKKEKIQTDAGEFDCFRLETNIGQTFWVADAPERYLVRFDAEGVTATLASVNDSATKVTNKPLGFSLSVPNAWFHFASNTSNPDTVGGFQLVSPEMVSAAVLVRDKALLDKEDQESVAEWARAKVRSAKRRLKDFDVREGSERDIQLAGGAGRTFIVDQKQGKRELTRVITLVITEGQAVEMTLVAPREQFAKQLPVFEELQKSLQLR